MAEIPEKRIIKSTFDVITEAAVIGITAAPSDVYPSSPNPVMIQRRHYKYIQDGSTDEQCRVASSTGTTSSFRDSKLENAINATRLSEM
jgi:hypothetical protein